MDQQHDRRGNCFQHSAVYECDECGHGVMCDVCHRHDEPRGECEDCPSCPKCQSYEAAPRRAKKGKGHDE